MADGATPAPQSKDIQADLNYIIDTGIPPVVYIDWPEEEHNAKPPSYEKRTVTLMDGRPKRDEFTLPGHGFSFVDHETAVKNFYDNDEVVSVYYPEVEQLLKEQTGAGRVLVFDHTVRTANSKTAKEQNVRQPVSGVHNDYTDQSAVQRVHDFVPDEAEELLKRRFAIVQVWRGIHNVIESQPLAMADGTSIPPEGFILYERRYKDRTARVFHICYHPDHKWYWFPRMTPSEALVFKVFDSDASAGVRFTAHTAFDDPTAAADARPRESIEMRALVFY